MMLSVLAFVFGVTAGWENICPTRTELPSSPAIWQADFAKGEFKWELREGALGAVQVLADGIRIEKTNDVGYILVTAKPFAVKKGQGVRFVADQTASQADVNFSSGALRYFGRKEDLNMDWKTETKSFWGGGTQTMRGLPCTAPGMFYRKYGQCTCKDDVLTPAIVVSGVRSTSVWHNWFAEDLEASEKVIQDFDKTLPWPNYVKDRIDEDVFDRMLAADSDHIATIERRDGFSRLVIDGEVAAPAVYHGRHQYNVNPNALDNFAGMSLDGSDVRLHEKALYPYTHWSPETGFDTKALAAELKSAMRLSTNSLFIVGICGNAPPDFIRKLHPEEAWINEKGEMVYGSHGSCILGYLIKTKAEWEKRTFPWPSPSSRVWRDWVCEGIRATVAELKAQGLTKRVVGIHVFGYHDEQFSAPYTDHSKMAQAEYAQMIAEPDCLSTNYAFCMKQSLFRAQEEFVRAFKQALGKPSIGIMWCESPFQGAKNASLDITSFCRSDAMDVIVCQPDYRERLPGYPTVSVLPFDSLHLHGKMFWNEYDYRTYAPISGLRCRGPISWKSLGTASDIDMWRTMYRKVAGEAAATRMGYWLYDMLGGWYMPAEIAEDIRQLAREEKMLARQKPSVWRPETAIVIDEVQILPEGDDPLLRVTQTDDYIYAGSRRLFGASCVPYERYLAEDVLAHPELLKDKKLVVLAFFRQIDARRAALLKRLSDQGTTQVFLSETGVRGGAEATRFETVFMRKGGCGQRIVPEPGVTENVQSLMETYYFRDASRSVRTGERCSVREADGVRVLARYADDRLPALAVRRDSDCLRVYVCASGAFTPDLFNRFARESGAFVATDRTGLQVDMNGDFLSVHCLQPGEYAMNLPYPNCRVTNLKSGQVEPTKDGKLMLSLTAGQTCRFLLEAVKPPVAQVLDKYVKSGAIAGVVSAISEEDGRVRFDCAGWADAERKVPMRPDSLFAIFSMTKTFTGTALMVAIDEGKISLDDEVARYLPEFADVKMKDGSRPKRPILIRDLMCHVTGWRGGLHVVDRDIPLREVARRLAATPLSFQPGETFAYGNSWICSAAAALEIATSVPYERYLQEKVLDPLEMKDTTFWPNADQLKRLVKPYSSDAFAFRAAEDGCTPQLKFPKARRIYPAASGGLYSTPADMIRFSQMLAHHGTWKGRQIVSRRTFDNIFAVKQTPAAVSEPYTVGSWLWGDWFGHEGAMRTDQRANLKTGQSRVFFIQTINRAGPAFFQLKAEWHAACDEEQGTPLTIFGT